MSDDTGQQTSLDEIVDGHSEMKEQEETGEERQELFGIGKVPRDWKVVEMDNCVQIIPGNSPPGSTYNESGEGLPFFQGNADFGHFHPIADTWCSDPRKTAEKNDILMSIRAPVGDLNIADRKCCIGRGLAALRPTELNGLYLYYTLAKREAWLSRLATGSTFKSVTRSDLERLDLPLPPLNEQRKIASVLYNVDIAIQKTEGIINQTKKVKKGLMQDLFAEGYYAHNKFVDTRIGKLPASWNIDKIKSHTELISGAHVKSELVSNDESLTPYLTGPDDFDEFGFTVTKYTSEPTKFCEPNDTLVTVKGSGCGKSTFADRRACISRQLKALRPSDGLQPLYLFYFIKTKQDYLETFAEGSAIPGLSNSHLTALDIPVPSTEEQHKIAETLRELDQQIQSANRYQSKLLRLKQGLLQDLIRGEIRTADRDINVLSEVEKHG